MNNPHGITAENLLRTLPVGIGWDETIQALAASIAEVLARRPEEISRLLIYSNIDHLDEELLDILAYDFKVDWWDGDYSLEEKRRTLKDSWRVHRMLGTKAAVETAISAIYPNSVVKEWFEYGGRPYYFKLEINVTNADGDLDKQRRVLQRINYYKNLRSHLDSVDYTIDLPPTTLYLGGAVGTLAELGIPEKPNTYDFRHSLHVGGTAGMHTQTSVPAVPNNLDFTGALHVGGNGGIHVTIPPDAAPPPFSIQRMGNVCTIIMDPPEGS